MSFIAKITEYLSFGAVKINKFPKPIPCGKETNFCQPTEQTDDIKFQYLVSESDNLIVNGGFTDFSAWNNVGWIINPADNNAIQLSSVNGLTQPGILTLNDNYRITLTVEDSLGGTLSAGAGTGISLINNALIANGSGTFTTYFKVTGGGTDFIISSSGVFFGKVSNVSVIKISDETDYTIQVHDAVDFTLIDTVPSANLVLFENVMTVDFNWADDVTVPNGCVLLRIFDNTNIFEDNFSSNQGWKLVTDVTISGGDMSYVSSGVNRTVTIGGIFTPGESYEITYDVVITGTGTSQVKCGNTAGTTRTVSGTFVETLLCTVNGTLSFIFGGAVLSTVDIDNIFIKKENNLDGQSECFDLETLHDCTLLWIWSNKERWGQFIYEGGFEHALRVTCRFRGTQYVSDTRIGENSAGLKTMDYSSMRKVRVMDIHSAADYIHDGIAAFFNQDNRTIDNISYILIDEYEPSEANDSLNLFKNLMTARIELEQSDQPDLINRNE